MAKEIERKFLVVSNDWQSHAESCEHLRQGYLMTTDRASIRIRISDDNAWLNIKSSALAIERDEFEYEIPQIDGDTLLERFTVGAIIEKKRYRVRVGEHTWDLDEFAGSNAGLVVAEIELRTPDESFAMPSWAGREVSLESRYYNPQLVDHPYCEWTNAEKLGATQ